MKRECEVRAATATRARRARGGERDADRRGKVGWGRRDSLTSSRPVDPFRNHSRPTDRPDPTARTGGWGRAGRRARDGDPRFVRFANAREDDRARD